MLEEGKHNFTYLQEQSKAPLTKEAPIQTQVLLSNAIAYKPALLSTVVAQYIISLYTTSHIPPNFSHKYILVYKCWGTIPFVGK